MKIALLLAAALGAAWWGFSSFVAGASRPFGAERRLALAQDIIASWPRTPQLAAGVMIDRCGPPDAISEKGMGWENCGRWKRIVVRDRLDGSPGALEQTVEYAMPEDKLAELAEFSADVRVSADGSAMTARSDDEALNFLELNLADGIGRGRLDAARARELRKTAVELSRAGKTSPLMEGLLFLPPPP